MHNIGSPVLAALESEGHRLHTVEGEGAEANLQGAPSNKFPRHLGTSLKCECGLEELGSLLVRRGRGERTGSWQDAVAAR